MRRPKITVIIITRNDVGVGTTLDALKTVIRPATTEIVVVDGSAPADYLKSVRSEHPEAQWVNYDNSSTKRSSFSQQRNLGISSSTGEYLVFLDCSCTPQRDWLCLLYTSLKNEKAIIGSKLLSAGKPSAFGARAGGQGCEEVQDVPANGMGLTREIADTIGSFDNHFTYGEDTDFCWRARMGGVKVLCNTGALVYHDWGSTKADLRRAFCYGSARAKLYRKHPSLWRQLLSSDLNVLAYSTYLLLLPITLVFPIYPLLILLPIAKNWHKSRLRYLEPILRMDWELYLGR